MALPPQVLLALGLGGCSDELPVRADADRQAREGDTCSTAETADTAHLICLAPPIDTGTGPCLSVQACLCTCENGAETGGWMIPALGLLAMARRRKRSDIVAGLEGELAPDVLERLGSDDPAR
jgi:hypothetical protein